VKAGSRNQRLIS